MKRCPECRRDYNDDSLSYCLDDGAELLFGPGGGSRPESRAVGKAASGPLDDGTRPSEGETKLFSELRRPVVDRNDGKVSAATAILPSNLAGPDGSKRAVWLSAGLFAALALIGTLMYFYLARDRKIETANTPIPTPIVKLYWQMSDDEKALFVNERSKYVQGLIGDEKTTLDDDALKAIRSEIDHYVKRKDSLSQNQFEEGLRAVYGRGTQYAPLIIKAYEKNNIPPALGLYQAMIESEFHDCPPPRPGHRGPVGMFQFSTSTAAEYGLTPADYCSIDKQADAAARHMADLASDLGEGSANGSLGLLSYMYGGESVREYLRQLRRQGITERSFWAIFKNRKNLDPPLDYIPPDLLPQPLSMQTESLSYVPRFFAAAVIGETPAAFDLSTPPLTTMRK